MSEGVMRNSCSKGSSGVVEKQRKRLNQRQKARILLVFSVAFLAVIAILGVVLHDFLIAFSSPWDSGSS